jgi:hypothetical protein
VALTRDLDLECRGSNQLAGYAACVLQVAHAHRPAQREPVDYILEFVAVDIDHYQRLMESLLERDVGILNYFSHVHSKDIKDDSGKLLEVLLKDVVP